MEKLRARLEEVYGSERWILGAQAAVSAGPMHKVLSEWGSEPLLVAANEGTGDLPEAEIVYTRSQGDSIVDSIREFFDSVEHPTPAVQGAVDAFDPDGLARVIAEPFATAQIMLGRPTFGVRRPRWAAWEDKMRVDRLWEELEVPHAPYRIVDPSEAPEAAIALAGELGTVWVADNSQGWHGGGEYVKWVADREHHENAVRWFSEHAQRVRVMPFLDGLPCSIHGWVTRSGVAVFLPVEILILRRRDRSGFVYAGVSTVWTADDGVTAEMRSIAQRVGEYLSESDGYRGPFGVDGVLTTEGFRPTELNPRMSAGAGVQLDSVDLPLGLVMRCEIEGLVDVDHTWLEETVIEQRDPRIHLGMMSDKVVRNSMSLRWGEQGGLTVADRGDDSLGTVTAGPAATGSYIRGSFDVGEIGIGRIVGPLTAGTLNLASGEWGLGLPELVAAVDDE
ncbi:MAG: ATP-grasp domain-containing protein [Acidimicrobiia bacterium]